MKSMDFDSRGDGFGSGLDRENREPMTGAELGALVSGKWGRAYDLQLRRVHNKLFLQVMWKYLGQVSFPLSVVEYDDRLNRLAAHLTELQVTAQVVDYIEKTTERPRVGRAVSIPLEVSLGERSSEWLLS